MPSRYRFLRYETIYWCDASSGRAGIASVNNFPQSIFMKIRVLSHKSRQLSCNSTSQQQHEQSLL